MIVFDNIVFSLQKSGGISVVWYEILNRICRDKSITVNFIEFDNAINNSFRKHLDIPSANIILHRSIWLRILRYFNPRLSHLKNKFIFHSSYYRISGNKNAMNITTVHDFTYERFEHGYKRWIHCFQKYRAIRKSEIIICISENTRQDLLKYLPETDINKIRVIYNGVSADYFVMNQKEVSDLPFPALNYVLFVGSRKIHKKFDLVVDLVYEMNLNLVIVGGGNLSHSELNLLEAKVKSQNYKFLGNINNNALNVLYNNALCLLYPSIYEGFGIPVIEAQRAGCPVIAFEGSSIREIIGKTPLLFKEHSVKNIAKCITLLSDETIRNYVISEGLKNSARFSWDNTYSELMAVYREVLNK